MDTVKVDVCYRPLRICWAIKKGDIQAFRTVTRLSHAMWGGRYSPIVAVDDAEEAAAIVDAFRVDMIAPIGDSEMVKAFPERFPHLVSPFFREDFFFGGMDGSPKAQVLDIYNALAHLQDTPELERLKKQEFRLYSWAEDDALADTFLMQLGAYPALVDTRMDYRGIVARLFDATEHQLRRDAPIPASILNHPTITYLTRHGLQRHHGVRAGWSYQGFYLGDASNFDDLVSAWNLRAADISIWFVDRSHLDRYREVIPVWTRMTYEKVSGRRSELEQQLAIWHRDEPSSPAPQHDELGRLLGDGPFMICGIRPDSWGRGSLRPPTMFLGPSCCVGRAHQGKWETQDFLCARRQALLRRFLVSCPTFGRFFIVHRRHVW